MANGQTTNQWNALDPHSSEMDCFDSLPKPLREMLANAEVNLSSKTIKNLYRFTGKIDMAANAISQMVKMELEKK